MDIEKEGELFEQWWEDEGQYHRAGGDDYCKTFAWEAWIFVKNQAIPDGFVLVPRELSADEARKHAEAMFNKVERMARNEQRDLSESEFELFKNRWIDARTLTIQFDWKAMIEAQEQSHD